MYTINKDSPIRLEDMHQIYGITQGRMCGECAYCNPRDGYFKCDLAASQRSVLWWGLGWNACGKFTQRLKASHHA